MRKRATTIAAITAAALALTACGGGDGNSSGKGKTKRPAAGKSVDCTDENLSQAEWIDNCSDQDDQGAGGKQSKPMKLGKAARTEGAQTPVGGPGGGTLEITPTTVVYSRDGIGETPENGEFAVVTLKEKPLSDHAVAESAPMEGGGWKWIAPDGQAVDEGNGTSFNVVPETYSGGGAIQPGSWAWDVAAFDLSEAQRGGTLLYTDGAGVSYRWKMPAEDAGPEVGKLKAELKP